MYFSNRVVLYVYYLCYVFPLSVCVCVCVRLHFCYSSIIKLSKSTDKTNIATHNHQVKLQNRDGLDHTYVQASDDSNFTITTRRSQTERISKTEEEVVHASLHHKS